MNKKVKIIGLLIILVVAGLVFYQSRPGPMVQPLADQGSVQATTVSLTIAGLYTDKSVSILRPETVLKMLQTLGASDPQLQLETKEYADLGVLVESFAGQKNGADNKYWQYKVNGLMPQIGADKLELNDGDAVEWFFAPSDF